MDTGIGSLRKIGWESEKELSSFMWERAGMYGPMQGTGQEPVKNFWVKTSRQTSMDAVIVSIFYRPPDQEEVDEALKQLEEASHS